MSTSIAEMIDDSLDTAATGIAGLDDILGGGLPRNRLHLIEGDPGVGKTTLALQFLLEGRRRGEPVLYVTLSETKRELIGVAASHGWSLEGLHIYELTAAENLSPDAQYTLFHPSEVELGETTRSVLDEVARVEPTRVVFDSLSEMRLLARDPLRYRRQILALKQFFIGRRCTVMLLDDRTRETGVQSLVTGVVTLEQLAPVYGAERRRLRVSKLRGVKFRGGYHDLVIQTGGVVVFPRIVAAEHRAMPPAGDLASGVPGLDTLLGGGLSAGTSTLIVGPAGVGKSAVATQYCVAASARGQASAYFVFDETIGTFLARSAGLGFDVSTYLERGTMAVQQVDPAELAPGEFAHTVRETVEQRDVRVVVIDSLNGYLQAMPEEHFLTAQLHELLTFLNQRGVATLLLVAQHGILGPAMVAPVDVSYLADTVILLRYFEARGAVRQAISVVKKRSGAHERTIREFGLEGGRLRIGEPLAGFHGILTGVPVYEGGPAHLLRDMPRGK